MKFYFSGLMTVLACLLLNSCTAPAAAQKITKDLEGKNITATIQRALAATPGKLVNVTIPVGTFWVDDEIVIPGGSTIEGAGMGRTFLKSKNGARLLIANVSDVVLKGFSLTSVAGHSSVEVRSGTYRDKVSARAMRNIIIENISIDNLAVTERGPHGISVKAWANEDISDVIIRGCMVQGAFGKDINTGVDNCYVASYDSDGSGTVKDVLIEDCNFSIAGRQNLSVAGQGVSKPRNITIRHCSFTGSSLAGIDLEEAKGVTIEDCTFKGNGTLKKYFDLGEKRNAMRSGLVCHNSEATVRRCSFKDAYIGFSAIHKEGNGILLEDCDFTNAPVANGHFAGFGETRFKRCQFLGDDRPVVHFYRARFDFENCSFSGKADPLLRIGGGGKPKKEAGMAIFSSCNFSGVGANTCLTADYEYLMFQQCEFQNFSDWLSVSGINRWNTFIVRGATVSRTQRIGDFPYQSLELLDVSDSDFQLTSAGLSSLTVNGEFRFRDNTIRLSSQQGEFMLSKQFRKISLINNHIERMVAGDGRLILLTPDNKGEVVIDANKFVATQNKQASELLMISGRGTIEDHRIRVKNNKNGQGVPVKVSFSGSLKRFNSGQNE